MISSSTHGIAREVVLRFAPEEIDIFDLMWEEYISNPELPLDEAQTSEYEIGSGLSDRQIVLLSAFLIPLTVNVLTIATAKSLDLVIDHIKEEQRLKMGRKGIISRVNGNLAVLRSILDDSLTTSELKTICFDLNIEYENLAGDTRTDKVRELIYYLSRRSRLIELLDCIIKHRPDIQLELNEVKRGLNMPEVLQVDMPLIPLDDKLINEVVAFISRMNKRNNLSPQ